LADKCFPGSSCGDLKFSAVTLDALTLLPCFWQEDGEFTPEKADFGGKTVKIEVYRLHNGDIRPNILNLRPLTAYMSVNCK
jgi:hypothetical protein